MLFLNFKIPIDIRAWVNNVAENAEIAAEKNFKGRQENRFVKYASINLVNKYFAFDWTFNVLPPDLQSSLFDLLMEILIERLSSETFHHSKGFVSSRSQSTETKT